MTGAEIRELCDEGLDRACEGRRMSGEQCRAWWDSLDGWERAFGDRAPDGAFECLRDALARGDVRAFCHALIEMDAVMRGLVSGRVQ
jgi:hypothetical protein